MNGNIASYLAEPIARTERDWLLQQSADKLPLAVRIIVILLLSLGIWDAIWLAVSSATAALFLR
jgi:hypothetical protein